MSNTADKQHYHLALFLPHRIIKSHFVIFEIALEIWKRLGGASVSYSDSHIVLRDDFKSLQQAIYHLSYQAKLWTKGRRHSKVKDFSMSRLK